MNHYDLDTFDDYLRGELGAELDAAVFTHLEACPSCRASYDEATALRDWLRSAAQNEERELPAMVRAHVWDRIRHAPPSPLDRLRALLNPFVAVPVAAAIAAAAFIGVPALHRSAPVVAAAYYLEEHAADASQIPLADHSSTVAASASADGPSLQLIDAADTGPNVGSH